MNKTMSVFIRIIGFLISFLLVVSIMVGSQVWKHDWMRYFVMTDRWLEIIFVTLVAMALHQGFEILLKWQFRAETKPKPVKKKRMPRSI